MIHDLFFRRDPQTIYGAERPTPAMHQLSVQAAHIVFVDLYEKLKLNVTFFQNVHEALARELGLGLLSNAQSYYAMCGEFLVERFDLWNDGHGSADTGRFVGEDDDPAVHQRVGDRHPLLLVAGKLAGTMIEAIVQPRG
jgi:hypothetical protein